MVMYQPLLKVTLDWLPSWFGELSAFPLKILKSLSRFLSDFLSSDQSCRIVSDFHVSSWPTMYSHCSQAVCRYLSHHPVMAYRFPLKLVIMPVCPVTALVWHLKKNAVVLLPLAMWLLFFNWSSLLSSHTRNCSCLDWNKIQAWFFPHFLSWIRFSFSLSPPTPISC